MSETFTRNDVPRGYLSQKEIYEYVNRIRCAAMFGDTTPCDMDGCLTDTERRAVQKKAEVRYEVKKICDEWRERIYNDCSYRRLSKGDWEDYVKNRIKINARDLIIQITKESLDRNDVKLDSELKWICMTWFEDLHTTIEYCPNHVCITPKDIYDSLWKCRDFELKHLWQRSIFLTTFLVTCFTGYGAVFLKLFKCMGGCTNSCRALIILNCAGILIAFVGCVLSVLWIMMGKGSKAWYEQYEKSIVEIETNPEYSEVMPNMWNDRVMHGRLQCPSRLEDKLFSTDAGRYSVSRINIVLGHVALIVWSIVYIGQSAFFAFTRPMVESGGEYDCHGISISLFILFIFLGMVAGVLFLKIVNNCKSTTIMAKEDEDIDKRKKETLKEIKGELKDPKTLIILGDNFNKSRIISSFRFPKDSRYIALDNNEQIDGIEDSKILRISRNENVEKFVEMRRSFFNNLSETNMIVVYDFSFAETYWPYLMEIVRVTGKNIFWIILCHTDVEKSDSSAQGHRQGFIDLAGLKNCDIVIDPEKVFGSEEKKND